MVGLGGLEPPTSPLSGARSSHLSYRPSQHCVANDYNLCSLRCLSLICNCVQIRVLCTRLQFLYRFSLLLVLQMRVVAGDSQVRMINLVSHEVTGLHARLHLTDSSVPEGVYLTGSDSDSLAERCQHPSENISVLQAVFRLVRALVQANGKLAGPQIFQECRASIRNSSS